MTEKQKLSEEQIQKELGALGNWALVEGKLHREYKFQDFVDAFGFMTRAAIVAESMGHHPEWFNVYSTVIVDLMTHDVDGLSDLDFLLAARMDQLAGIAPPEADV